MRSCPDTDIDSLVHGKKEVNNKSCSFPASYERTLFLDGDRNSHTIIKCSKTTPLSRTFLNF